MINLYEQLSIYSIVHIKMTNPVIDEHIAAHVAELFRTFSDTSRVRILSAILEKEENITALAQLVGVTESAVSHHMRGLRQMRIVQARRDGKEVFYSVVDPHIIALFQQGVKHVQE
jgi:ArsR family transcriptional regulator, lead/cadmium/zinc/bismuth-responsive transcriptional repressor